MWEKAPQFHQIKEKWQKWTLLTPENSAYDRTLLWIFIGFIALGFLAVTSASTHFAMRKFNDPLFFSMRDASYIVFSLIVFLGVINIPSEFWKKYSGCLYFLSLLLVLAAFIFGKNTNGASRWLSLGFVTIQPIEFAKLGLLLYCAAFYDRRSEVMKTHRYAVLRPILILIFFSLFSYIQSDTGSIAIAAVLITALFFIVGAPKLQFLVFIMIIILTFVVMILTSAGYKLGRILSFLDPSADPYGINYQTNHSLWAFGRGEIFGVGLGNSIQKTGYLTEAHNDFIMAIIAEEFGFIGICFVLFMLSAFILRAKKISQEAFNLKSRFNSFFAIGLAIWFCAQAFINLGSASGAIPAKGLTFPFISYGGSSMLASSIAIAILFRIDYENRLKNKML